MLFAPIRVATGRYIQSHYCEKAQSREIDQIKGYADNVAACLSNVKGTELFNDRFPFFKYSRLYMHLLPIHPIKTEHVQVNEL